MANQNQPDDVGQYISYLHDQNAFKDANEAKEYEEYLRSQPGITESTPERVDLYPDSIESTRAKMSFADPEHQAAELARRGYKDPHQNADGEWVAQGPNGHWYADQNNFWGHPLNWVAANAKAGVKNVGWLGGALLGDAMAGGVGPQAVAGGVAGAGAGTSLAEMAAQAAGRMMGVYGAPALSKKALTELAKAGGEGAAQEAGGRVVGAIPLPGAMGGSVAGAIDKAADYTIKPAAAAASYLMQMGQTPYKDILATLVNPKTVSAASERGYGLKVGQEMDKRLDNEVGRAKAAIQSAQDEFRSKFGEQSPDVSGAESQALDFLERHKPNAIGDSRLSKAERDEVASELLKMHEGNADTLLTQRQRLGSAMPGVEYEGSVTRRGDATTGQLKKMAGGISDALHEMDPTGLGTAEPKFNRVMDTAKLLRPVEKTENAEGVVNNLWSRDNTARQEAAKELMPDLFHEQLEPLRAAQTWNAKGWVGDSAKDIAARTAGGLGLGTAASMYAHQAGPAEAAIITAALLGTSPKAHYLGAQALGRTIQDQTLPIGARAMTPANPWSLMSPDKEKKHAH